MSVPPLITVLGKLKDTEEFIGRDGYNVFPESADWTSESGLAWLIEAVERGDWILLVSTEVTGEYAKELQWLNSLLRVPVPQATMEDQC